jgi:hypothetical protein
MGLMSSWVAACRCRRRFLAGERLGSKFQVRPAALRPVTRTKADSHEVRCSSEVCMQPALQGFWVPCTPARLRRFHLRDRPLPTAVHRFFRNRNILPRASRPLQSARVPHPPRTRSPEQLPWGLAPLRDINQQRPHSCGIPGPHCVPSSASLTPSTVCSATGLAGLFHPAAASRVRPSGDSSSNAAVRTRRPPIPSCR